MRDSAATSDRLVRFLLGELPLEEREAIERACLTEDRSLFAELVALEHELRLAYRAGQLPAGTREAFEARGRHPAADRARLGLARVLGRLAAAPPRTPTGDR